MALSENLPVFKATYDLLLDTYRRFQNVPRSVKFTIVEKIREELLDVLAIITAANIDRDKQSQLERAWWMVQRIKLRVRLLSDLHAVPLKLYAQLSMSLESISKQLMAWRKSSLSNHQQHV
ncbi:MAG: four helix bundle protein [Prevotella sp.]|uniref:four helix bundle protein n=1 Tax=Prevotella sp. AGR2160 TaxID=1280674 RepID=UPI000414B9E7|nr:four helix bundle protein [Prevotella sp. AGR2160]MDD5862949.1 four helix bundle protein [Prevotella sp.]